MKGMRIRTRTQAEIIFRLGDNKFENGNATEMGAIMPCRPIQTEIRKQNLRRMVVAATLF
jgi:hypothetical protein